VWMGRGGRGAGGGGGGVGGVSGGSWCLLCVCGVDCMCFFRLEQPTSPYNGAEACARAFGMCCLTRADGPRPCSTRCLHSVGRVPEGGSGDLISLLTGHPRAPAGDWLVGATSSVQSADLLGLGKAHRLSNERGPSASPTSTVRRRRVTRRGASGPARKTRGSNVPRGEPFRPARPDEDVLASPPPRDGADLVLGEMDRKNGSRRGRRGL